MRFQKIATGTVDPAETNYRILAGKIEDLTRNSKCLNAPPGHHNRPNKGHGNRPNYGGGYGYARNTKREASAVVFPQD